MRKSPASSSGTSYAAKCPPRSCTTSKTTLQRRSRNLIGQTLSVCSNLDVNAPPTHGFGANTISAGKIENPSGMRLRSFDTGGACVFS